ncbi:uncharacterized protein [Diadema antillarum]|uniref:uncharacterized protein n=1 Tax=Diadema antillarum TaxID=105358 RepID=UPI003A83C611
MVSSEGKQDLSGAEAVSGAPNSQHPTSYSNPGHSQQWATPASSSYSQQVQAYQVPTPTFPQVIVPPQQQTNAPTYDNDQVSVVPHGPSPPNERSFVLTAILLYSPLGIFGCHHFYLNNLFLGFVYSSTMGIFGIGWVVDWFRIWFLVRDCNEVIREARERGHWLVSHKYPGILRKMSVIDAYLLWLPPFGLFGIHHMYLGRVRYGLFYTATLGLNIFSWFMDLFRIPFLVWKANKEVKLLKQGGSLDPPRYSLLDAYLLHMPLGLFGLHHFYLRNYSRGILYLFTLGVFGLGWLADLFQMPLLVNEANKNLDLQERVGYVINAQGVMPATTSTVIVVTNNTPNDQPNRYNVEPPPPYAPQAPEIQTVPPPPPAPAQPYATTNYPPPAVA